MPIAQNFDALFLFQNAGKIMYGLLTSAHTPPFAVRWASFGNFARTRTRSIKALPTRSAASGLSLAI